MEFTHHGRGAGNARQEVRQELPLIGLESATAGNQDYNSDYNNPSGEDHYIQDDAVDMPYPHAAGGSAGSDAVRLAHRSARTEAPPPRRVISGSSGDGGEAPPHGGLADVPDNTTPLSSLSRGCRQVPSAASPSFTRSECAAASDITNRRPQMSPRAMPSPRRCFDLEQHMASVEAALPMSPNRSTAARAAVARLAGYGGMYGVLLPSGAAGEVLDEDETVEDILDECISRGALT